MIITGHRGALGSEPENTLRSFRRAIADGCDEIELDLRVTADGELVILHDATVDRTTNGTGEVAELTLAELRALDAGLGESRPDLGGDGRRRSASASRLRSRRPPPSRSWPIRSEADPAWPPVRWSPRSIPRSCLLSGGRFRGATTGRIFGRTDSRRTGSDHGQAEATWALCGITGLTSERVAELHAAGLSVTAWPVPDGTTFEQAIALGVDGITTDHPHASHVPPRLTICSSVEHKCVIA